MFSLFHYLQPLSLCPSSSIPCPPFHPPSLCHSVTLVPVLHLPSPLITSFHIPVSQLLASLSHSIFIFPTSIHYSLPPHSNVVYVPCDSMSHFLHSLYYPICCTSPSLVVYKSFQLVVYSLACNCHPLLFTQSPLSLPLVSYHLSPDNTIPLCLPCLTPLKLRTTLFLGKDTTHKLKPSPYPYTAVFCLPYIALHAPHSVGLCNLTY